MVTIWIGSIVIFLRRSFTMSLSETYNNALKANNLFIENPDALAEHPEALLQHLDSEYGEHSAPVVRAAEEPDTSIACDVKFNLNCLYKTDIDKLLVGAENAVIAGGSVCLAMKCSDNILAHPNFRSRYCENGDIDIFICDTSNRIAALAATNIQRNYCELAQGEPVAVFISNNAVTLRCASMNPVQIITMSFDSVESVFESFDVDCVCVGYYKGNFVAARRAIRAFAISANVINPERSTQISMPRLKKYADRGWDVLAPGLDRVNANRLSREIGDHCDMSGALYTDADSVEYDDLVSLEALLETGVEFFPAEAVTEYTYRNLMMSSSGQKRLGKLGFDWYFDSVPTLPYINDNPRHYTLHAGRSGEYKEMSQDAVRSYMFVGNMHPFVRQLCNALRLSSGRAYGLSGPGSIRESALAPIIQAIIGNVPGVETRLQSTQNEPYFADIVLTYNDIAIVIELKYISPGRVAFGPGSPPLTREQVDNDLYGVKLLSKASMVAGTCPTKLSSLNANFMVNDKVITTTLGDFVYETHAKQTLTYVDAFLRISPETKRVFALTLLSCGPAAVWLHTTHNR